jgi:adenine deaminase
MSLLEERLTHYDELLAAARGEQELDLVIRGARTLNVFSGELLPGEIGILHGFIVRVYASGLKARSVIEAEGKIAIPAFIDPHLHIESSMVLPPAYAAAVVPHGTGTILTDPHEIVNVMGLEGFQLMQHNSRDLPLRILYDAPTCVPSRRKAERSGADIRAAEIHAMIDQGAAKLGELMSDEEIIAGEPIMTDIIKAGWRRGVPRDAHYILFEQIGRALGNLSPFAMAALLIGLAGSKIGLHAPLTAFVRRMIRNMRQDDFASLDAYLMALGITAEHENLGPETQIKIDRGMRVLIKPHIFYFPVLPDLLFAWLRTLRYRDMIGACTDDIWPDELITSGGIAGFLRDIVRRGVDPVDAIRFATFNNARRLAESGLQEAALLGAIAPGYSADLVLLDGPLRNFQADTVLHGGRIVAREGVLTDPLPSLEVPDKALHTVFVPPVTAATFSLCPPAVANTSRINILEMPKPPELPFPRRLEADLPQQNGTLLWEGYTMIAVFNRYGGLEPPSLGLIQGYTLREGALASTVAHDSHNLIVLGRNAADMALAAQRIIDSQGGMVAVQDGQVLAHIPLPVGGLMALANLEEMAALAAEFRSAIGKLGLDVKQPILPFAIFSLGVGPGLKITDRGVWDNSSQSLIPLFVASEGASAKSV